MGLPSRFYSLLIAYKRLRIQESFFSDKFLNTRLWFQNLASYLFNSCQPHVSIGISIILSFKTSFFLNLIVSTLSLLSFGERAKP